MADTQRTRLETWQIDGWTQVETDIATAIGMGTQFADAGWGGWYPKSLRSINSPGATFTAELHIYQDIWVELDQNCTITVQIETGEDQAYFMARSRLLINTKGFTVSWGGSITWLGGAPTLSTNTTSIIEFLSPDAGTTILGRVVEDSFTEITQSPSIRTGFNFGSSQRMWTIDLATETYHNHEPFLIWGANLSCGAVSDQKGKAYIGCGSDYDEYFEEFNVFTRASHRAAQWYARYFGGRFRAGCSAAFDWADGVNQDAWFAGGTSETPYDGTYLSTLQLWDIITSTRSTYSHGQSGYAQCTALSDRAYGRILAARVNDSYIASKTLITWSTGAGVSSNPGFNTPCANTWNNQVDKGYLAGGYDGFSSFNQLRSIVFATEVHTYLAAFGSPPHSKGTNGAAFHLRAGASNNEKGFIDGSSRYTMPMATETLSSNLGGAYDQVFAMFNDFGRV